MEDAQIIKYLNQYFLEIMEELSKDKFSHFRDYFFIKQNFSNGNIDGKFKDIFCNFYRLNGPMGLTAHQKDNFFIYLLKKEMDLEKTLRLLYAIPGHNGAHRLFLSFASKLIHTVNDKNPIYDKNIALILSLPRQAYPPHIDERIKNRLEIYSKLKDRFNSLLSNNELNGVLTKCRNVLRHKAAIEHVEWRDDLILDVKLLDSLLWALYYVLYRRNAL